MDAKTANPCLLALPVHSAMASTLMMNQAFYLSLGESTLSFRKMNHTLPIIPKETAGFRFTQTISVDSGCTKGGEVEMKQITLFQCEICGTEYKFKNDAEKCEKHHIKPAFPPVAAGFYKPFNQQCADPYPYKVILEMEDGNKLVYRR